MSTALATFQLKTTRSIQSQAGVGSTLAYNEILRDVLPPIVAELEKKIADLERRLKKYEESEVIDFTTGRTCLLCNDVGTGCRVCMGRR